MSSKNKTRIGVLIFVLLVVSSVIFFVNKVNSNIKDGIWRQKSGNLVMEISGKTFNFLKGNEEYNYPQEGTYSIVDAGKNEKMIILRDKSGNTTQYTFTKMSYEVGIIIDGKLFVRRRVGPP